MIEYMTVEVVLIGPDGSRESHDLPATLYACACGHSDADLSPAYTFPTCAACGAPVMPERERLEVKHDPRGNE